MVIYCHVRFRLYIFIAEICMENKVWYSDHYSDLSTPTVPNEFTNLVPNNKYNVTCCMTFCNAVYISGRALSRIMQFIFWEEPYLV